MKEFIEYKESELFKVIQRHQIELEEAQEERQRYLKSVSEEIQEESNRLNQRLEDLELAKNICSYPNFFPADLYSKIWILEPEEQLKNFRKKSGKKQKKREDGP